VLESQKPEPMELVDADEALGWIETRGACVPPTDGPKAGARRVLLLGGTTACGRALSETETLRAAVEHTLSALACPAATVQSGGAAGYDTEQALAFWRAHGRRYTPEQVVLLFDAEDLYANATPRAGRARVPRLSFDALPLPLTRWHGSAALRLISNASLEHAPPIHRALARVDLTERPEPPAELWGFGPRAENDGLWERTEALLRALRDETQAQRAALSIVYVPQRVELSDARWDALQERYRMSPRFWRREKVARRLAAIAESLGVPLLDMRDALAEAEASGRPTYVAGRRQWNAEGTRIAGDAIARRLASGWACAR
jgi:hypothetical protein